MDTNGMRVAFIGNFGYPYSTENELAHAMGVNGIVFDRFSELRSLNDVTTLIRRLGNPDMPRYDFILWISTKGYRDEMGDAKQWELIATAKRRGIPIVAIHLDRWWGLAREHWLDDPYYKIDLVCTADGGHEGMWETKQINHHWLPPAISERWCVPGKFREEYACDVVFVGNWVDYGHTEWQHRYDLIRWLNANYGSTRGGHRGLRLIPKQNHPAIRGLELNDVYWSAKVVVGDSCLVPKVDGSPMTHYCSDRVPETLGRGGILLHPSVEGIDKLYGEQFTWQLNDWADLRAKIDLMLEAQDGNHDKSWLRGSVNDHRLGQIGAIKANHTYTVRVRQLVDIMHEKGLL